MIKTQQKPQQNPHMKYLLSSKLFTKVGNKLRSDMLKLNDSRFFLRIPPGPNVVLKTLPWFEVPPGMMNFDLGKFNHTRDQVHTLSLEQILQVVKPEVSEHLKKIFGMISESEDE